MTKKMIEVEKKVLLEPSQIEEISRKGTFLQEIAIKDTYFDRADFYFTLQNMWLRQRDGVFELKKSVIKEKGAVDFYEEILDEKLIKQCLSMYNEEDLKENLVKEKILPFCSLITQRKKYQLGEVVVDMRYNRKLCLDRK